MTEDQQKTLAHMQGALLQARAYGYAATAAAFETVLNGSLEYQGSARQTLDEDLGRPIAT